MSVIGARKLSASTTFRPMVIAFPLARRRAFIDRTAKRLVVLPPRTAEKLLVATLQRQADAMARKGIVTDVITHETRALEIAIRNEMCRQAGAA